MRVSLLTKLVVAYLVPTVVLLVVVMVGGSWLVRDSMEKEIGQRLIGHARAAASSLNYELLLRLEPGDENSRTFRNIFKKLELMRVAAKAERLYVFDKKRRLICGAGLSLPVGSPLAFLERDRMEIERVFQGEASFSTVVFESIDGRTILSGYVPVMDASGTVVAGVGAEASDQLFVVVQRFSGLMIALWTGCCFVGLVVFSLVGRRWLVRPIKELLLAAERIGKGDLQSPLTVPSNGDELALLAIGMESMRERLCSRDREMQMMLAGIAHEVRNPLGGMELFAGLLAEDLEDDPSKLQHVQRIQKELRYLQHTVEDFLGWAREARLTKRQLAIKPFLAELLMHLRGDAEKKGQSLELRCEDFVFMADEESLRRMVLNLLRNAVEATPDNGRILLTCTHKPKRAVIEVQDSGPGVPFLNRERIFAPFFSTKEKGLGLGLAFVRRIAETHGGSAFLQENGEEGATFVIELPLGIEEAKGDIAFAPS